MCTGLYSFKGTPLAETWSWWTEQGCSPVHRCLPREAHTSSVTIPPKPLGCRGLRASGLRVPAGVPSPTSRTWAPAPLRPAQVLLLPHQTNENRVPMSRLPGLSQDRRSFPQIAFLVSGLPTGSPYPQWGWGSPFLFPSIFSQAGEAWGREGKNSIFHRRQVCQSVCPLAAGGRPVLVLGSHIRSEGSAQQQAVPSLPGASTVALASMAAGRPLPWTVPWRTRQLLGSDTPCAGKPRIPVPSPDPTPLPYFQ